LINGEWHEVSNGSIINNDNEFAIDFDASDNATSSLLSQLRNNKAIDEIVVHELATTDNKPTFSYYLSKALIKSASSGMNPDGEKVIRLNGVCISFRQKTKDNYEPVLWDSNTMRNGQYLNQESTKNTIGGDVTKSPGYNNLSLSPSAQNSVNQHFNPHSNQKVQK